MTDSAPDTRGPQDQPDPPALAAPIRCMTCGGDLTGMDGVSYCESCGSTYAGPDSAAHRPFCDTWPWPNSDLDLVTEEHNAEVHRARGCCDGFPARLPVIAAGNEGEPPIHGLPAFEHVSDLTDEEANDV